MVLKKANISLISAKKTKGIFVISVKIFENKKFFKVPNLNQNNIYNILASISIIYSLGNFKKLYSNLFSKSKIHKGVEILQ